LISDRPLAASPFLGRRVLISCSCPKTQSGVLRSVQPITCRAASFDSP
jgi:hypothetical protein